MFLLPYASALFLSSSIVPDEKAILLISSVYTGVLRVFAFFLLLHRTRKFKTDQNIHPQDFEATPSWSYQQQSLCHELYNDILLSRQHLLMVFKPLKTIVRFCHVNTIVGSATPGFQK